MFNLAISTFLLFFGMGAIGPILSLYLVHYLHFTDIQAGMILALSATSAIIAPLVGSFIADRFVSSERLLSLCLFGASASLFLLFHVHGFWVFLCIYFFYIMLFAPCSSLNNTVIFHHIKDRKKDYGRIRVFGTLGWICVAWLFSWSRLRGGDGLLIAQRLPEAILVSAVTFAVLGFFAFFIPAKQKPNRTGKVSLLHWGSIKVIRKPQVMALVVLAFISVVVERFYIFGSSLFLFQSGISPSLILPFLSLGQFFEIPAMLLLGLLLTRLGIRNLLMLGISCNMARYAFFIFSEGNPLLILSGTLFHGLAYTFFFSSAAILLDSHSNPENRAGVHQLFNVLTIGLGSLVGSLASGTIGNMLRSSSGNSIDFDRFWGMALALCIVNLFLLVFLAGRNKRIKDSAPPLSWLDAE